MPFLFAACPGLAGCGADAGEVDARCYDGDLHAALGDALASDRPLLLPRGTYSLNQPLVIDYAAHAGTGFLIISRGAIIDGTSIHSGPVLEIICSGGSRANPSGCFYFHQEGTLFVNANTPDWAVRVGLDDFSDAHNSAKIDHLIVNNNNGAGSGGAVRLNYVLNSEMFIVADAAGGGAGLALEQVQFSRISGAASAMAGTGLSIENGYSFANTIQAIDLEVAELCLTITSARDAQYVRLALFQLQARDCLTGRKRQRADQPNVGRRRHDSCLPRDRDHGGPVSPAGSDLTGNNV